MTRRGPNLTSGLIILLAFVARGRKRMGGAGVRLSGQTMSTETAREAGEEERARRGGDAAHQRWRSSSIDRIWVRSVVTGGLGKT